MVFDIALGEASRVVIVVLNIVEKVDKRDYIVNFDKIKNELNFSTKFLAEDGIEEMVKILEDGNFDLEQSNV